MDRVSLGIDAGELLDFSELLQRARAQMHALPAHMKEAALRLSKGGFHEVVAEPGGIAVALTPEARAVAAVLRVCLRP